MTIDEAIKRIEDVIKINEKVLELGIDEYGSSINELYADDTEMIDKVTNFYKEAIEYHSQIVKWLKELKSYKNGWIFCEEHLPTNYEQYLVIDADGDMGVGYYRDDVKAWDSPNWGWLERKDRVNNKEAFTEPCGLGKVLAWMPLPASYKKEEDT